MNDREFCAVLSNLGDDMIEAVKEMRARDLMTPDATIAYQDFMTHLMDVFQPIHERLYDQVGNSKEAE